MECFEYGNPEARTVLLQMVDGHDLSFMESEVSLIRSGTDADFRLCAFLVEDWNRDLSPWEAPAVFGREGFGSGAPETLGQLLHLCGDPEKTYFIGGYSLAGLFALWAAFQTDRFQGVAAASPSVWFPGFPDYAREHEILVPSVYLSLGDREEKTRNPVMATVAERIRELEGLLRSRGVDCTLEWNEGNHFRDADRRTAKAFLWLLNRM